MPRVTFQPAGQVAACADGASLFDAGGGAAAGIETACVGKGTCGLCRVKVLAGAEFLSPYTEEEEKHLGNLYHLTKVRLACRTQVAGGDVVIELAPKRGKRK
jgi:ferredoxin